MATVPFIKHFHATIIGGSDGQAARENSEYGPCWSRDGMGKSVTGSIITERVRDSELSGAAVEHTTPLYRAFFDHSSDAICLVRCEAGGEFVLEAVNPVAVAIFDLPGETLIGRT